jgi:hypothetical protein
MGVLLILAGVLLWVGGLLIGIGIGKRVKR